MISATESISPGWDPHPHNHHQHYHCQPHHPQENPQLKLALDGNNPRKIPDKIDEEMGGQEVVKIERRKRPTTKDQDQDQVVVVSRVCVDCRTSKTPLWRSGPAGPKSLCNACGIRFRKRRRREFDFLEMRSNVSMKEKNQRDEEEDKRVVLVLERKFEGREEAEAALLLMALSCGLCVH